MSILTEPPANKTKIVIAPIKLVESMCKYIDTQNSPPSLSQLAKQFKLSPYYLQRMFKRIVGISPKQYAQQTREQRLKKQLQIK